MIYFAYVVRILIITISLIPLHYSTTRAAGDPCEGISTYQPENASEHQTQQLLADANILLKNKYYTEAIETLREILQHQDSPNIHYKLMIALLHEEKLIEAYQSGQKALVHDGCALTPEQRDRARQTMIMLSRIIAKITIICDQPGVRMAVNGRRLFTGPGKHTSYEYSGEYEVTADKPGYMPRIERLHMKAGTRVVLRVERLVRIDDTRSITHRKWIPWSMAGAGLSIALLGVYPKWAARQGFREFDNRILEICSSGCYESELPGRLLAIQDTAHRNEYTANIMLGVGTILLITNVALMIYNQPQSSYYHQRSPNKLLIHPMGRLHTGASLSYSF